MHFHKTEEVSKTPDFYILSYNECHFIKFDILLLFKIKKKKRVEEKLISIQILNKTFLLCLHRVLPGDKGHVGATVPCKRQLPYVIGCHEQCCPLVLLLDGAHHCASPAATACSQHRFLTLLLLCPVAFALTALLLYIKAEEARAEC